MLWHNTSSTAVLQQTTLAHICVLKCSAGCGVPVMAASLARYNLCATTSGCHVIGAKTPTPTAHGAMGCGRVCMRSWGQPVAGFNQDEFDLKKLAKGCLTRVLPVGCTPLVCTLNWFTHLPYRPNSVGAAPACPTSGGVLPCSLLRLCGVFGKASQLCTTTDHSMLQAQRYRCCCLCVADTDCVRT